LGDDLNGEMGCQTAANAPECAFARANPSSRPPGLTDEFRLRNVTNV
jgi:hypothetical protein